MTPTRQAQPSLERVLVGIIDASLLRKSMLFYTGVDTHPFQWSWVVLGISQPISEALALNHRKT